MKRRCLFGFLLGLLACLCAAGLAACDNGSDPGTPGESVTYTIAGAEDVYLKLSDTDYDFAEGVSVSASNGSAATLSVNDSAVKFGVAGTYDVVYSCGDQSVTVKAYVFALPAIADAEQGAIQSEYADVQANLYKGLTATDSLGQPLDIAVVEGTENPLYDERGIPQYGEHQITYSATDRVGQTTTYTRTFEVIVGQNTPSVTDGAVSADVADDVVSISVDLKGQPVSALYIGDVQVSDMSVTDGSIQITMDDLTEQHSVGEYDATLMTNGGYADFKFTLSDAKPMQLGWWGLDNWAYTAGTENCAFPVPEKLEPRQDISFEYALKSVGGTVLNSEDGLFTAPAQAGKYTLSVTYSRGQDSEIKDLSVYILTEEEKAATLARGDSLQNPDELPFTFGTEQINGGLLEGMGYTEDEGVGPAYKLSGRAAGGDQCFAFVLSGSADAFGGSDIDEKYKSVWIDIYYEGDSSGNHPWIHLETGLNDSDGYIKIPVMNRPTPGNDNILNTEKVRVYSIEADGSTGDYAAPQTGKWLRYAISLEDYRAAVTPFLWIGNEYGGTFYVRHAVLSEETIGEDLPLLNNGLGSSIGLNYDAPNLSVTGIAEETIGGRDVVSLTHDYTLNVQNSKPDLRSLALCFGILMDGRVHSAAVPDGYKMLTFEFYAEEGADLWFYFGYNGTNFVIESAKTSEAFCVYDESGNRIAVPAEDGWYTAEVSLDTARSCALGYIGLGIVDNTAGHKIAVDPLTLYYLPDEFVAAPTPDLPLRFNGVYGNIAPDYDTVLWGAEGTGYLFAENETVGGRSGIVTLQTLTHPGVGNDRRNRAIGFGKLGDNGGTSESGVPSGYNTLIFDLYATEGASISVLFGNTSARGGYVIVDLAENSAVRAYSIETGEYLASVPANTWVRIVVDLSLYRECLPANGGNYARLAVCNNAAGTSISVDPLSVVYSANKAETAALALSESGACGSFGRYCETALYNDGDTAYNYTENDPVLYTTETI